MPRVGKKCLQNVQLRCFHKLFQGLQAKPLLVSFPKLFLYSLYGTSQCYISSDCNSVEAGNTVLCETPSTTLCHIVIQFMSLFKKSLFFRNKHTAVRNQEFLTNQEVEKKGVNLNFKEQLLPFQYFFCHLLHMEMVG